MTVDGPISPTIRVLDCPDRPTSRSLIAYLSHEIVQAVMSGSEPLGREELREDAMPMLRAVINLYEERAGALTYIR